MDEFEGFARRIPTFTRQLLAHFRSTASFGKKRLATLPLLLSITVRTRIPLLTAIQKTLPGTLNRETPSPPAMSSVNDAKPRNGNAAGLM